MDGALTKPWCCHGAREDVEKVDVRIRADSPQRLTCRCPATPGPAAPEPLPLPSVLPAGPAERTVPTYATEDTDLVCGEPLCCGRITKLSLGETMEEVNLAVYVNGFVLSSIAGASGDPGPPKRPFCQLWSPFSLVEKCQVRSMHLSTQWAVFKLTVFKQRGLDVNLYFACTGDDACRARQRWVEEFASAISTLTYSLFPVHAIEVRPVPGKESTSKRIMAGYLLKGGAADKVAMVFCELHAYAAGLARIVFYTDHWCEQEVDSVLLVDSSQISTRKGSYCTVFGVDDHRLCARSREEKELWVRAVSNVKVKLMFAAPDPSIGELDVFRTSVAERVEALDGRGGTYWGSEEAGSTPQKPMQQQEQETFVARHHQPLLPQLPRLPPDGPRGDRDFPLPDAAEDSCGGPDRLVPYETEGGRSACPTEAILAPRVGPLHRARPKNPRQFAV